ncbi:hypothetical protein BRADI_3g21744v3 [Brachypodium distachyon]|uniref:DRBM domain-containing protein n=1 Tax=Brachypodium distachyon TaxID=15368 RepID=A0A2K2CYQ9_BRADI|nr:hypothetical protein BRADI_3g21744v3 [Brachypodium distachyon]
MASSGVVQRCLVRVPRRLVLAEAVKQLSTSPAVYSTSWSDGCFLSTVEITVRLCCHEGCSRVLKASGSHTSGVQDAEEKAAGCMIRTLRIEHGVRFDDINRSRFNKCRRNLCHETVVY